MLLSGPTIAIISLLPQHIFLPLIPITSVIFYPYTPTNPPLSISIICVYIYLSLITHILSPLSHTHFLSPYITPLHPSIPASYSIYHFLLLNSSFSHYLTLYLSKTFSITLSAFYISSASSIYDMTCYRLYRSADLLPLAPILLLLNKLQWGR